jgi:uncharacterized protein YcgL (UPF0745 family)
MLCAVYKSPKKKQTYLFIKNRDDFSAVPEALMAMFGTPTLVTVLNLANKDKLALADISKVRENINHPGFYLQLPPPEEDLLKSHKEQMNQQSQQTAE